MPDLDLSVTICSWNTRGDLETTLRSIEAVRDEASLEVLVVDNSSEDGSQEMVERLFPWVTLHKMNINLGFGKGHNYAMARSTGAVIMPLNSDTVVHEGALRELVNFLRSNPDVGIVGPRLLNPDGTLQYSCRRFPTPAAAIFRNTPLGRLFPNTKFVRDYLMLSWDHEEPRDVDWVSGAAFCMRRDLYDKIGGFDEQFFMYLEDVDICFRTHEAGYRVVYLPSAKITHAIGRSTDQVANQMINQFHNSMKLFYKKHYLKNVALPLRPVVLALGSCLLWMRKTALISKNKMDDWKRRRKKR